MQRRIDERLSALSALAAVIGLYLVLELALGITCPIKHLTGVSCAGCGMSRAWMALLRGDVRAAAGFHPLFWLPPIAAVLWLVRKRLPASVRRAAVVICCVLMLGVWVLRMADPTDSIVAFAPNEGLIVRVITRFIR